MFDFTATARIPSDNPDIVSAWTDGVALSGPKGLFEVGADYRVIINPDNNPNSAILDFENQDVLGFFHGFAYETSVNSFFSQEGVAVDNGFFTLSTDNGPAKDYELIKGLGYTVTVVKIQHKDFYEADITHEEFDAAIARLLPDDNYRALKAALNPGDVAARCNFISNALLLGELQGSANDLALVREVYDRLSRRSGIHGLK